MRFLCVLLLLLTLPGCGGPDTVDLPDDLVGVWTTSARRYEDRFFELTKDEISFGALDGDVAVYEILRVEPGKVPDSEYAIYYTNEEGREYKLSIAHTRRRGVIRFENQKKIAWTKEADESDS